MEVLPSLNRRNRTNTCVRPIASSPYACCNNWYVSVAVFPILKQNLMQMRLFGTFTHRKYRCDINARVTSPTYYSQLSKRSHLQLVSWVAKTCTNMSRLVANTSHPVNNHYNSNPDTIWTNLVLLNNLYVSQGHPGRVAQVTFRETEGADACVAVLNGRWFGQWKITAETWDGNTKYKWVICYIVCKGCSETSSKEVSYVILLIYYSLGWMGTSWRF